MKPGFRTLLLLCFTTGMVDFGVTSPQPDIVLSAVGLLSQSAHFPKFHLQGKKKTRTSESKLGSEFLLDAAEEDTAHNSEPSKKRRSLRDFYQPSKTPLKNLLIKNHLPP